MAYQVEKRTKTRYTTQEVLNYILEGGEDSDLSGLSDSENENEELVNQSSEIGVGHEDEDGGEDGTDDDEVISQGHSQVQRKHAPDSEAHETVTGPSSADNHT